MGLNTRSPAIFRAGPTKYESSTDAPLLHPRAALRVARGELRAGERVIEIPDDRAGLVHREAVMLEGRDLREGLVLFYVRRFFLLALHDVYADEVEVRLLLGERTEDFSCACADCAAIELHDSSPRPQYAPCAERREDGTCNAPTHLEVTMARSEPACDPDDVGIIRAFMTKVGDKWSVLVLVTLARTTQKRARFSELQKKLAPISHRVLTMTLRTLERDGFITREAFAEVPPRVEYELTTRGKDLLEPLELLVQWITANWPAIKQSRRRFDDARGR